MNNGQPRRTISSQFAGKHQFGGRQYLLRVLQTIGALGAAHFAMAVSAQSATASDIVVAIAGPTSGPQSDRMLSMQTGARKAADAINARGGIKGAKLRIELADDGCYAAKAIATAAALAAQKVDLVIGHPCDAAAIAAAKAYGASRTLFIAMGTRHHAWTRPAGALTVFRLSGRDDRQGLEAAKFLATLFNGKTIAVVHDRTSASIAIADNATKALIKAGMPSPISGTVIGGDKDFPVLTAKIKSAAAIFYAGYPLEAGSLLTQVRKAGSSATFLMSESNSSDEFANTFGAATAGAYVMRPRFALTDDGIADVETRISAADSTLAEAAVTAFAAAANAADSLNSENVARELSARSYTTAQGLVEFDETGEGKRPSFDVFTWTGQHWEAASSAPLIP